MKDLHILRNEIDGIDDQIVALISRRFEITNEIGRVKAEKRSPALDRDRENQIMARLVEKSRSLSLNPELIQSIFKSILSESVIIHNRLIKP